MEDRNLKYYEQIRKDIGISENEFEAVFIVFKNENEFLSFDSHQKALAAAKKILKEKDSVDVKFFAVYNDRYNGKRHPGYYAIYTSQQAKDKEDFRLIEIKE